MNLEGLEQDRVQHIKDVYVAMSAILKDPEATAEQKIEAGKLVDNISDSIIKAWLLSDQFRAVEKTGDRLGKQLDKLIDNDERLG